MQPGASPRALLIIDVFNRFHFEGGLELAESLLACCPAISQASALCRSEGVPVIYCNDNFQQWGCSPRDIIAFTEKYGSAASARIAKALKPDRSDLFLLKSQYSAFFNTQLSMLLNHFAVRDVAIAGVCADIGILSSAIDAHLLGYTVTILENAATAITRSRTDRAFALMRESFHFQVCASHEWLSEPREVAQ